MVLYDQKYKKVLFGHTRTQTALYNKKQAILAAVANPRWNSINNKHFDGKLGICSFTLIEMPKETAEIALL